MNIDAIKNGIVIDHIKAGNGMELYHFLNLEKEDCSVAIIKNVVSKKMGKKDIIKIDADIDIDLNVLGYIDPDSTVNIIKDGKLMKPYNRYSRSRNAYFRLKNRDCFVFKGEMLKFNVYDDTENNNDMNVVYILKREFISAILCSIITFLNINYGRDKKEIGTNQESVIL